MSYLNIDGKNVYYEIHGEGQPLIILNGIMMSTLSWQPFVSVFTKLNLLNFIDFYDQCKSDKFTEPYTQDVHVEMLKQLFDKLGYEKVDMVGVSYGGEVALKFAIKYQEKLRSLIISNSTAYTNNILKLIGDSWVYASEKYSGKVLFQDLWGYLYADTLYEENLAWVQKRQEVFEQVLTKDWFDSFIRLVRSAESLDVRAELHTIKVPTLLLGADQDCLTPVRYQEELLRSIPGSQMMVMKGGAHVAIYEKPQLFASAVLGFVQTVDYPINCLV